MTEQNPEIVIEKLLTHNLDTFTRLTLELWHDCQYEEEREYYLSLIPSDHDACFLLKNRENGVGFIHVSVRFDYVEGAENRPTAYLEGIFIKPEYRNKGLGKRLIQAGENWAKTKGIKQMASDTPISNAHSINFHSKAGFRETERIVCFIKDL